MLLKICYFSQRFDVLLQYLTFEPDEGGWNNIRMAMETAVTMALAMGRILGRSGWQ